MAKRIVVLFGFFASGVLLLLTLWFYYSSRGAKGLGRTEAWRLVDSSVEKSRTWIVDPNLRVKWLTNVSACGYGSGEVGQIGNLWQEETSEFEQVFIQLLEMIEPDDLAQVQILVTSPYFRRIEKFYLEPFERQTRISWVTTTQYNQLWYRWLEPILSHDREQQMKQSLARLEKVITESKNPITDLKDF